ncbi:MAG: hypothetical protein ACKVU1_18315 [bacterium]
MAPSEQSTKHEHDARLGARTAGLRASILAGIVYDWIAAALIFAARPEHLAAMRLPAPADPFHFKFAALLLAILPVFYLLPWRDPQRYSGVVGAMIVARLAGCAYLALYGAALHVPATYSVFALIDLVFAAAHALLARRARLSMRDLFPIFAR